MPSNAHIVPTYPRLSVEEQARLRRGIEAYGEENPPLSINEAQLVVMDLSSRDRTFHYRSLFWHGFSPFTGRSERPQPLVGREEGPYSYAPYRGPPEKAKFVRHSKEYDEFKRMVNSKGWLITGKMPATASDCQLEHFMVTYGFDRRQVQRQFKHIKDSTNIHQGTTVEQVQDDGFNQYLQSINDRLPSTEHIIEEMKQIGGFQHFVRSPAIAIPADILGDMEQWSSFQTGILAIFAKGVHKASAISQATSLKKRHDKQEEELRNSFADNYAARYRDEHPKLRSALYILSDDFRSVLFNHIINNVDQEDLESLVCDVLVEDESKIQPEHHGVREKIYYIAGWLLVGGNKVGKRNNKIALKEISQHYTSLRRDPTLPVGMVETRICSKHSTKINLRTSTVEKCIHLSLHIRIENFRMCLCSPCRHTV